MRALDLVQQAVICPSVAVGRMGKLLAKLCEVQAARRAKLEEEVFDPFD